MQRLHQVARYSGCAGGAREISQWCSHWDMRTYDLARPEGAPDQAFIQRPFRAKKIFVAQVPVALPQANLL